MNLPTCSYCSATNADSLLVASRRASLSRGIETTWLAWSNSSWNRATSPPRASLSILKVDDGPDSIGQHSTATSWAEISGSSATSATSWSAPSASGESNTSGVCGYCSFKDRRASRTWSLIRGISLATKSRCPVTPTISGIAVGRGIESLRFLTGLDIG